MALLVALHNVAPPLQKAIFMTKLKLINIYLDGFRACHYDKKSAPVCPYEVGTEAHLYWARGFEYAERVDKFLQGPLSPDQEVAS